MVLIGRGVLRIPWSLLAEACTGFCGLNWQRRAKDSEVFQGRAQDYSWQGRAKDSVVMIYSGVYKNQSNNKCVGPFIFRIVKSDIKQFYGP